MVSVKILDVVKEESSNGHLILLTDDDGGILPIFVGPLEAAAVAAGVRKSPFPRPMTYDLMCNLLEAANVTIPYIAIVSLRESTFYSTIHIRSGAVEKDVDARPSDAIALAVRVNAPMQVAEEVMKTASVRAQEVGRSAQGTVAMLKLVNERLKQVAAEKGWKVPDLLSDPNNVKARSLLFDT